MSKVYIENLTEEQIAKFPEYVDKWTKIGLCTDPADRPGAEKAIELCYKNADLAPPKSIIWCDSPLAMMLKRASLLKMDSSEESLKDSISQPLRDSVDGSRLALTCSFKDSISQSLRDSVDGSHLAAICSFYDYFRTEVGLVEQTEKITGIIALAKTCGWILPFKEVCFASERHNILNRDDRGRLHNLSGPSVGYPDGFKIYAVHGVRVPEYIIERPNEITVEKIDQEKNVEIRRVMMDIYGTKQYIQNSNSELIHSDKYGKLYKKSVEDDEDIVMVQVINSTAEPDGTFKEYFLRVPPDIKTAHEAVAWGLERTETSYKPTIET